jgi:hypothetical protein
MLSVQRKYKFDVALVFRLAQIERYSNSGIMFFFLTIRVLIAIHVV